MANVAGIPDLCSPRIARGSSDVVVAEEQQAMAKVWSAARIPHCVLWRDVPFLRLQVSVASCPIDPGGRVVGNSDIGRRRPLCPSCR